ncbi:hypothetical protein [Halorubrum depositum]|jgi:hypothetical protein|uniref:hypothetical protein n=1 Tax=Halorubrum depositum TaxID=2583992 RepID=UPI0011A93763|nr:hypothetical protein [Halorubrum depositum]
MPDRLADLRNQFNRADQEKKRQIGEYLYSRPARWVSRQEIVGAFDIDESGVSRHIDGLHEAGYLQTKYIDDQRYVQWDGRGAGGIRYWVREATPPQLWAAGSELRPLFSLDSLGGAYVPTLLFGILILIGFFSGIVTVVVVYLPSNSALGVTATDMVFLTGIVTMMAAVFLLIIPVARLLDIALQKIVVWSLRLVKEENKEK